jgi:hypothetical protein
VVSEQWIDYLGFRSAIRRKAKLSSLLLALGITDAYRPLCVIGRKIRNMLVTPTTYPDPSGHRNSPMVFIVSF